MSMLHGASRLRLLLAMLGLVACTPSPTIGPQAAGRDVGPVEGGVPPVFGDGGGLPTQPGPNGVIDAGSPVDAAVLPPVACRPGAIDLAPRTVPNGISIATVDGIMPLTTTVFDGQQYSASDFIELCFPSDTVSFLLSANGSAVQIDGFQRVRADGSTEDLINGSTEASYYDSLAAPYFSERVATLRHPNLPAQRMQPIGGSYRVRLRYLGFSQLESLRLTVRRGTPTRQGTLRINVVLVDGAIESWEEGALNEAIMNLNRIYQTGAGVSVVTTLGRIADPSLLVTRGNDASFDQFTRALRSARAGMSLFEDAALTIYVVRDLDDDGSYYGISSGIPGFVGLPNEGIIAGIAIHRRADGTLDGPLLGETLGHEVGHFLGLRHTTEATGENHDLLDDTPRCETTMDVDYSSVVSGEECRGFGGENLMFWNGIGTQLSASQAAVLLDSPITRTN